MSSYTESTDTLHQGEFLVKRFSVEEANRALALVRPVVEDIMFEYARMVDLQETIEAAQEARDERATDDAREQILECVGKLHQYLQELTSVGVRLQDWSLGLVDFPSLANGREVSLCWQYGHESIRCWHEVDEGCASRRELSTLTEALTVVT